MYRFEVIDDEPGEWKERGTGEIKLMKHKISGHVRVLMRRDKTLKLCANHYSNKLHRILMFTFKLKNLSTVTSNMELKPHQNNEKTWTWSTLADFSDEEPKPELLCIRFKDAESILDLLLFYLFNRKNYVSVAQKFKTTFDEVKKMVKERENYRESKEEEENEDESSENEEEEEEEVKEEKENGKDQVKENKEDKKEEEKLVEKIEHIKIESKDN